ncbi:hypothetical protein [Nocardioides alcanivorans]|uniref:hypothetical protein n=1 Tax=Nocardioides alcanivorans TaxID=2897352 RepID=UPI001F17F0EB|nr:hypothetical protein [Nocardioides alcanivorans]
MSTSAPPAGRDEAPAADLTIRTVPIDLADLPANGDLLALLPTDESVSWVRQGEGLVGWGVAAQVHTAGPTRFADAAKWWSELILRAAIDDQVDEPGTGPVCFGSFGFADEPGHSTLVLPGSSSGAAASRPGSRPWGKRRRR